MPLLATLRRAHLAWVTFFLLAFAASVMPSAAQAWDITGSSRPGSNVGGDAKDDLVWYHNGGTNAAHVLLSNGTALNYAGQWRTGLGVPDWAGLGDFNGDGKDEPAWFHAGGSPAGTVSVLPSNGSSFGVAQWISGLGRPNWVGVGDFNNDNKDDLAWYHATGSAAQTISVLLSTGTSFSYAGRWATGIGVADWAGVGDFDFDGKDDLAWYNGDGGGTIHVLKSTGTSFAYSGHWGSGYGRPDWATTGDFNGDRKDDLAWYHADGGSAKSISVLLSTGAGFTYNGQWATGVERPEWAGVGDYSGDGKDDLAWYRPGTGTSGNVNVLRNTGTSTFAAQTSWAGGLGRPQWAGNGSKPIQSTGAGADFNNDGADDLFWYHKENSQAISAVLSDGSGSFSSVSAWRTGMGNADWTGAGDFNRDGKEDIAWYHKENSQAISVARSNGSQFDNVSVWRDGMGNPDWAGVGDFTGDGRDDIAWYHKESQKISVARSDGTKFDLVNVWREGMGKPDWAGVGDFNGDGKDDIAWYHKENTQAISVALSDGSSFYTVSPWRTGMGRPDWAGVGDFTGDGRDDIAWYHSGGTQAISVLWGDGTAFQAADVWRTGMGMPDWAGVGSFNGDTKDDLAWYHKENSQAISIAWSSGTSFNSTSVARTGMGVPDWAGPGDISRRYPTSWDYGAANHRVDTPGEADPLVGAIRAGTDEEGAALFGGLSDGDKSYVVNYVNASWPTSRAFGGGNWTVDTQGEMDALGAALAASSNRPALWAGLSIDEKGNMLSGVEGNFSVWAPSIDTQAPSPQGIVADGYDSATQAASITWDAGDDPDVEAGVPGTGSDVARFTYRWKRNNGSFSAWTNNDAAGFDAAPTALGDSVTVEVRGFDLAGNISASTTATVTVTTEPATQNGIGLALLCGPAAPTCAVAFGVTAGALVVGQSIAKYYDENSVGINFTLNLKVASSNDSKIAPARTVTSSWVAGSSVWDGVTPPTLGSWEATQASARGNARTVWENPPGGPPRKMRAKTHIHHIVPVTAQKSRRSRAIMYKCRVSINDLANLVPLPHKSHYRTYRNYYHANLYAVLQRYEVGDCNAFRQDQLRITLRRIGTYLIITNGGNPGPWPI